MLHHSQTQPKVNFFSMFQIRKNPGKYVKMHRRQKQYEAAYGDCTLFSIPSNRQSPGSNVESPNVTERELKRSDANVKDKAFKLTRIKMKFTERATAVWIKLKSGDKEFLMGSLKATVSIIKNAATPIGENE